MAEPPSNGDAREDTPGRDRESIGSTPRWVKVFGVTALIVIVVLVVLLLTGGHGPGRHSADAPGGHARLSSVTGHGVQAP